jgi:hypothetical protein
MYEDKYLSRHYDEYYFFNKGPANKDENLRMNYLASSLLVNLRVAKISCVCA